MDWTTLLFSFEGRINRGKYWLAILIYTLAWFVFIIGTLFWLGGLNIDNLFTLAGAGLLVWLVGVLLLIAGVWSGLATGIKRLHDRDKSGWWIILFWLAPSALSSIQNSMPWLGGGFVLSLAAMAIGIWAFVELCCLRGTAGPNQYGPDPLAAPQPHVAPNVR
jgi:uncharacterized membrane protein YhaH (DUF805 family)